MAPAVLSDFTVPSQGGYDGAGDRLGVTATLPAAPNAYTYSATGQVTGEQTQRGGGLSLSYGYDGGSATGAGDLTLLRGVSHSFNADHQDTANTYDGNGNPTTYVRETQMRQRTLSQFAFALVLLSLPGVSVAAPAVAPATPVSLPALTGITPSGQRVDISRVPGWRVVYFWAGSCPCVTACEHYSLKPLAEKYKGRISFFAVVSDGWDLSLPRKALLAQIASHHLPYPLLLDTHHTIALALHAKVTPQTVVLDPQGRVVFHGMPDDSHRFLFQPGPSNCRVAHTYLSVALAEAMAGKPVTNSPLPEAGCIVAW